VPLANLVRSEQHCVYGLLVAATHVELRRLYDYARDGLGGTYLPEAVLVQTLDGKWLPALCYLAPDMEAGPVAGDYLDRIVGAARQHGFPDWYVARLESFRSKATRRPYAGEALRRPRTEAGPGVEVLTGPVVLSLPTVPRCKVPAAALVRVAPGRSLLTFSDRINSTAQ
jgi:hypothetical protein